MIKDFYIIEVYVSVATQGFKLLSTENNNSHAKTIHKRSL